MGTSCMIIGEDCMTDEIGLVIQSKTEVEVEQNCLQLKHLTNLRFICCSGWFREVFNRVS